MPRGQWRLEAVAPRVSMDEALWSVLRFGMGAAGPGAAPLRVQFAALHAAVHPLDLTIKLRRARTGLTLATA